MKERLVTVKMIRFWTEKQLQILKAKHPLGEIIGAYMYVELIRYE